MATPIEQRGYAHPDVLVSTDWVAQHLTDPKVRLIESNEDTLLYASAHVPGAVHVDWTTSLNDQLRRDYITRARACTCPTTRTKGRCAAATPPARRACHGRARSTRTRARSRRRRS